MAQIQPLLHVTLDPTKPVSEICAVIAGILPYHPGQEEAIVKGVRDAMDKHLKEQEGVKRSGKSIRESDTDSQDQG